MRLAVDYSIMGSRRCQDVCMCYMLKLQSGYMQQVIITEDFPSDVCYDERHRTRNWAITEMRKETRHGLYLKRNYLTGITVSLSQV